MLKIFITMKHCFPPLSCDPANVPLIYKAKLKKKNTVPFCCLLWNQNAVQLGVFLLLLEVHRYFSGAAACIPADNYKQKQNSF